MCLNNTGFTKFTAPDSVTVLEMTNNPQLTKVTGNNIKEPYLSDTGVTEFNDGNPNVDIYGLPEQPKTIVSDGTSYNVRIIEHIGTKLMIVEVL